MERDGKKLFKFAFETDNAAISLQFDMGKKPEPETLEALQKQQKRQYRTYQTRYNNKE